MIELDQLKPGLRVRGLVAAGDVTVVAVEPHGERIVNVVFPDGDGHVGAISDGVSKLTWQTETFAYAEGHDGNRYASLAHTQHVSARPGAYVIRPDVATAQIEAEAKPVDNAVDQGSDGGVGRPPVPGPSSAGVKPAVNAVAVSADLPTTYYASFSLDSVRAIRQLEEILRNVVEHLGRADGASVALALEINAQAAGFDDRTRGAVSENATQLGAKGQEFERVASGRVPTMIGPERHCDEVP